MRFIICLMVLALGGSGSLMGNYGLNEQEIANLYGYNVFNETGAYVDGDVGAEMKNELVVIVEDGHAGVNFQCRKCGSSAGGYTAKVSLYPAGYYEDEDDDDEFLYGILGHAGVGSMSKGLSGGIKKVGMDLGLLYYLLGKGEGDGGFVDSKFHFKSHELKQYDRFVYELTDGQAAKVKERLDLLVRELRIGEKSYIFNGYNCVDFAQDIYNAAGLPGVYFDKKPEGGDFSMKNPANVYAVLRYEGVGGFAKRVWGNR